MFAAICDVISRVYLEKRAAVFSNSVYLPAGFEKENLFTEILGIILSVVRPLYNGILSLPLHFSQMIRSDSISTFHKSCFKQYSVSVNIVSLYNTVRSLFLEVSVQLGARGGVVG
jgi:hypothetical protein